MMRVLLSSFVIGAASLCFPDGIPESERKELVNGDERYPVGLWIHDYAAQYATAELVAILVQEKVGYKLEKLGLGQLTPDAFFALAGCTRPTDSIDRGCSPDMITRAHISVEGWTGGYSRTWDQVQQDYPQTAPRNLGSMGYNGAVTLYIAGSVQDCGYQAEGISLDFYRDYNLSWRNPAKYFTKPQEINTSKLLACSQTTLMYVPEMKNYLEMTGDEEGVTHQGNGDVIGRCFDGHFWYAPACRANSSGCIPVITGGTGWSLNEMMQKGTLLSIPLATAVGKTWSEYTSLPAEYSVIFYWWVPDPSFLRLDAIPIRFPPFSRREWEKEMKRSEAELMSIDKYISQDLAVLAPDIERFMSAYALDIKDVEEIMSKKLDSGKPYFDVACDWLHANAERWQKWLPDKTKCFARYGLYNVKEEKFVDSRANPDNLKCEVCSPGSYSEPMKDLNGSTYVCQSCPQGSYQVSEAATQCDLCLKGEYQDDTGSSSCKRCGFGRYQDTLGQSSCKACPNETTTVGFGSLAISECGCLATTIAAGSNSSEGLFQCQPCPVGLECPLSSSIETLQRQEAALGAEYVPRVLEGYFADPTDPLVIYKCQPSTYCPGGKPGECAGGLSGKPCSTCSHGQTWTGEKCDDCRDEAIFIWAGILLLGTLLLFRAYNFVDSRALAEVSPVQACMIATSMTINVIQMIAVFGLMSVTWTPLLASTSSSLSFVLLDLDQLGASCVTGSGNLVRFLASGALFPAAALAILGRWALSRCLVRWALRCRYFEVTEWKLYKTVNFAGTLTQVGFATLSAWSLKPLMCYRHPNGSYSLLNYPGAFCGEAEQITMAIFGTALMAIFVVGFLCLCMFASWKLPTWSADGRFELVQSFTFLTSKFRLNTWWFGIALLLRGMCLSITVVLGTNQPEVQVALARVTLLIYLCSMVLVWPWKARALNLADTVLNSCLLLLVSQTVNVSETFSAVILIFILLSVASLGILCLLNLAISGKNLFNLGLNHDAAKISLTLKDCAEELLEIEACRLDEKLRKLNHYDIEVIKETITLISTEILVDAHHSFNTRMHFKAATRHGTTQFDAHVEASHEDLEPENEEVTLEMRIGLVDLGPTVAETL